MVRPGALPGRRRRRLDLKAGGLAPVVSLARRVAIVTGDVHGTLTRRHLRESFRAVGAIQNRIDADWRYRPDRVAPAG